MSAPQKYRRKPASRMALKIHKRGDAVQDFEHGLRILGIITDATARDAITNIEREQVAA